MRSFREAMDTLVLMLLLVPHLILLLEHGPDSFPGADWSSLWVWIFFFGPWFWLLWRVVSLWKVESEGGL